MAEETESTKNGTTRLALDTQDTGAGASESDKELKDGSDAFPSAAPTLPTPPSMHPVTTTAHSISSPHMVDYHQMTEETKSTKDGTTQLASDTRNTCAPESETELKDGFDGFPSAALTSPTPPSKHSVTTAHSVSSQHMVDDHQMAESMKVGITQPALATEATVHPDTSDTGRGTPGLLAGTVVMSAPIPPTHLVTTTTPPEHMDPRATVGLVSKSGPENISNTEPSVLEREAPASPPLPSIRKTSLIFSNWPNHMVDVHQYLTEETVVTEDGAITKARNWGDRWLLCLESFFEFQSRAGFPKSGPSFPLFTNVRPLEIANWMKNGRHWQDAHIIDVEEFARRWWAWWHLLQPKSRICDEGDPQLPTSKMDWSDLRKPGKNGFLLIIISLVWWGKRSDQDEHWIKAISDVTAVLLCLNSISGPADKPEVKISSAANAAGSIRPKRSC